jgi:hypothetical protein
MLSLHFRGEREIMYRFFIDTDHLQAFADLMDDAPVYWREVVGTDWLSVVESPELGLTIATQYPEGVSIISQREPSVSVCRGAGFTEFGPGADEMERAGLLVAECYALDLSLSQLMSGEVGGGGIAAFNELGGKPNPFDSILTA